MQIVKESIEFHIPYIPTIVLMIFIVWIIIFVLSFLSSRKPSLYPRGLQNFTEMLFEWIFQLADRVIGDEAFKYYPLFLGIFFFILVSNLLGIIPGLISPTANLNITMALAITVFFYYHIQGLIKHRFAYFKKFIIPGLPLWMLPVNILIFFIEVISHFVRPLSLSLRLFCNLFAKEALLAVLGYIVISLLALQGMEKFIAIVPLLLRPVIILLAVLIGVVQALIFLILSIIYVGGAVKSEH